MNGILSSQARAHHKATLPLVDHGGLMLCDVPARHAPDRFISETFLLRAF